MSQKYQNKYIKIMGIEKPYRKRTLLMKKQIKSDGNRYFFSSEFIS